MVDGVEDFFEQTYEHLSLVLGLLLFLGLVEEVKVRFPGQGLGELTWDLPLGLDLKGSVTLSSQIGTLPRGIYMGIGLLLLLKKLKLSGLYWGTRGNLEFVLGGPVILRLGIPLKLPQLFTKALQPVQVLAALLLSLDTLGLSDVYLDRGVLAAMAVKRYFSKPAANSPRINFTYSHLFLSKELTSKTGTPSRVINVQGLLSLGLGEEPGEEPKFNLLSGGEPKPTFPSVLTFLYRGANLLTGLLLTTGLIKVAGIYLSREGHLSLLAEPSWNNTVKAGEAYGFFSAG